MYDETIAKLEQRIRELEKQLADMLSLPYEKEDEGLMGNAAAQFNKWIVEVVRQRDQLQAENESQKQRIMELEEISKKYKLLCDAVDSSDADCLPGCDEYAHEEKCPSANSGELIVKLQQRIRELEQRRSETIAMCAQLQTENDQLTKELARLQDSPSTTLEPLPSDKP